MTKAHALQVHQRERKVIHQERKEPKTVKQIPPQELWAGQRLISTIRVRNLTADGVSSFLRIGKARFVVAEMGKELRWIPNNQRFDFWKNEIKQHLTTWGNENSLDALPDSYFYLASEWQSYNGMTIVLLEKYYCGAGTRVQ